MNHLYRTLLLVFVITIFTATAATPTPSPVSINTNAQLSLEWAKSVAPGILLIALLLAIGIEAFRSRFFPDV